jgi:hypothetical protein
MPSAFQGDGMWCDAMHEGCDHTDAQPSFDASPQQPRALDVKKCLVFLTTPFHNPIP